MNKLKRLILNLAFWSFVVFVALPAFVFVTEKYGLLLAYVFGWDDVSGLVLASTCSMILVVLLILVAFAMLEDEK